MDWRSRGMDAMFLPEDQLLNWLDNLSGLRTFWTKEVEYIRVISHNPLRLQVKWISRRGCKEAFFIVSDHPLTGMCEVSEEECCILMTESKLDQDLFDRWSVAYLYKVDGEFLEPNNQVEVSCYEEPNPQVLKDVLSIQMRSWGFYIPPRRDTVVFIARIHGTPVGSAYYHRGSSNIDYGIHVSREYWRRRIGTRLLHEIRRYVEDIGGEWFTVVRVLRGVKPTSADRRAIAFYEANHPEAKINIYRLKKDL